MPSTSTTQCGQCGEKLADDAPGQRPPCPKCGSTKRIYGDAIEEGARARDGNAFRHKGRGKKKPLAEGSSGFEPSHATPHGVEKQSLIDRENDRRYEHVEDAETGEVLHHEDHPLSEHVGHGSDKKNRKT